MGFCQCGVLSCGVLSVWGFVLWGFVLDLVDTDYTQRTIDDRQCQGHGIYYKLPTDELKNWWQNEGQIIKLKHECLNWKLEKNVDVGVCACVTYNKFDGV